MELLTTDYTNSCVTQLKSKNFNMNSACLHIFADLVNVDASSGERKKIFRNESK